MPAVKKDRLSVLELFAGIGGCAAALGERAEIVAAVDIHAQALAVYQHNFHHPTFCRTIESLPIEQFTAWNADLWWLSPPCQPYTRKGHQRDLADPRAQALLTVIDRIEQLRPHYVALENVPPFAESQSRARLIDMLGRSGYNIVEQMLCPSELGVPNRRRRYYLLASLTQLAPPAPVTCERAALARFTDQQHDDDPALLLEPALVKQYAAAIDIVDADDSQAMTSCFASAYGNSIVRSGSYLRTPRGLRRFAPDEVQRLLGFPEQFAWPESIGTRQRWRLLGNSLSLPAIRRVLSPVLADDPTIFC
jgi:site-specific DNA-cytosine methylase